MRFKKSAARSTTFFVVPIHRMFGRLLGLLILHASLQVTVSQIQLAPGVMDGTVRNLRTREPLVGVRVTLATEETRRTYRGTTDEAGRFSIAGLQPGRYTVTAEKDLFFRPLRDGGSFMVTLAAGERVAGVSVFLSPTAVIAGRVIDEKRNPLRSVRVEALRSQYRDGVHAWTLAAQNLTDDRGEFRLYNLEPGSYYVRATVVGSQAAPQYYPRGHDSQNAVILRVDAGVEQGGIDIQVTPVEQHSVLLALRGIPPGSSALFNVRRTGGIMETLTQRATAIGDGNYRLEALPPGSYDLFIQVSSMSNLAQRRIMQTGRFPFTISGRDEDLGALTLTATQSVVGRLTLPKGLPSLVDFQNVTITLRSNDHVPPITTSSVRGAIQPDRTFTVPGVGLGHYQVTLNGLPPGFLFWGVMTPGQEVPDPTLTVKAPPEPVELVIGDSSTVGSVYGLVIDAQGRPTASAMVVLVPSMERQRNPSAFKTTVSDQHGGFSFRSIVPSDYRVMAWEHLEPGSFLNAEVLRTTEARGEFVRVQRGSESALTVHVIPTLP